MSTAANQPENLLSDAKPSDPSSDQPPSEPPEAKEEGECGFCVFMKGGGCKDTFIDWENCMKKTRENKEDPVDKCSQVITSLINCMSSHSDYYNPIISAKKHFEEKAVAELMNGKQDSALNNNQQEASSQSNQTAQKDFEEKPVVEVENGKQDSAVDNNKPEAPKATWLGDWRWI